MGRNRSYKKHGLVWTIKRLIYFVLGILEVLLLFRFVLKLLGADSGNAFVSAIYNCSKVFVTPFSGIFKVVETQVIAKSLFEPASILAVVIYALIGVGLVRLIEIIFASRD